jgi:hypothetical protein
MSPARPLRDLVVGPNPSSAPSASPGSPLAAWAATRGLEHRAEGLLPPVTPHLRRALGAGSHKASTVEPSTSGWTTYSSARRVERPERATTDRCEGVLPGGLTGMLARHTHLDECSDGDGGSFWAAYTSTVVFAELGDARDAVCELAVGRRTPVKALASFGRARPSSDPRRSMVAPPRTSDVRDGLTWSITPAEDAATLDTLVAAAGPELAVAPKDVAAEVEFGYLCVHVPRALSDAAELDALCRAAAAIAEGLAVVAARNTPLMAAVTAGAPERTDRRRWIEAGVATLDWPAPPADVPTAVRAYERVMRARARRVGWAVAALILAIALAATAVYFWVTLTTGIAVGGVFTAGFAAIVLFAIVRAVIGAGREVTADETASRARPWGLAAFTSGYAAARGLTLEDPDKLRRGFASPLRGRAVAALHGRLAGRADGHLVIWFEPGAGTPGRYWLLAITRAPGRVIAPPAPYQAEIRGDLLVTAVQVGEDERSAAALDALAAVAADAAE